MKLNKVALLIIAVFVLNACETTPTDKEKVVSINGYAQKGPFINGTSITLYELTEKIVQTGKTFSTQISDNSGTFNIANISLSSDMVLLHANGFYFNEVSGKTSTSMLNLFAVSDISETESVNVNILSHLIKDRILQLIEDGADFRQAKTQAQQEILKIFKFEKTDLAASESLNINEEGDDNAVLLAISVILQGERTDSELSELLATIISDLKPDGVLDNTDIQSELVRSAIILNTDDIRSNLEERYKHLGMETAIPPFEKYVNSFIDSSNYEAVSGIVYPVNSNYGTNILYENIFEVTAREVYSMAANLETGSNIKIRLSGGSWYYEVLPNAPVNWTVGTYNKAEKTQEFTSTHGAEVCDLRIQFMPPNFDNEVSGDTITMEYFENYSTTPTITRKLAVLEE